MGMYKRAAEESWCGTACPVSNADPVVDELHQSSKWKSSEAELRSASGSLRGRGYQKPTVLLMLTNLCLYTSKYTFHVTLKGYSTPK